MKLASFSNLPGCSTSFDLIGLQFNAQTKAGNDRTFFWSPPFGDKPDRLFKWVPETSTWKECPIAGLSQKKRDRLWECWQSQTDIGLWITHSKRLQEFNRNLAQKLSA